jgi:thioredoxin 1
MLKAFKVIICVCLMICYSGVAVSKPPIFLDSAEDAFILSEDLSLDLLLVFGAKWCVACDKLKNDIHKDLSMVENTVVCYVDIEKRPDFAKEFKVKRIPECIIYRNKKEIKRRVGYKNKIDFLNWLSSE